MRLWDCNKIKRWGGGVQKANGHKCNIKLRPPRCQEFQNILKYYRLYTKTKQKLFSKSLHSHFPSKCLGIRTSNTDCPGAYARYVLASAFLCTYFSPWLETNDAHLFPSAARAFRRQFIAAPLFVIILFGISLWGYNNSFFRYFCLRWEMS